MKKRIKLRSFLFGGFVSLLFIGMMYRMYVLQVVDASALVEEAMAKNWQTSKQLKPLRGTIFDRNNKVLAQDAPAYTVAVNPKLIHQLGIENEVTDALAPILGMMGADRDRLYQRVTAKQENGNYYVQREVRNEGWLIDSELADEIRAVIEEKGLKGVTLAEDQKRYYPSQDLAAHVLGYYSKDDRAVMGIEKQYNDILKGTPGQIDYEKDRLGYELPNSKVTYEPAINGDSLRLTLDENIQMYIEQAMQEAYDLYQPISMTGVAADPSTMEILGMASFPNFNPNKYWEAAEQRDFYNTAIGSVYEPGSTFKIVALSGAVQEDLFDPNDTYKSGRILVGGSRINDHNGGRGWNLENDGYITYLEGLKRSSNVAFVKLGYELLGYQKFYNYTKQFGFGNLTGIDLPGEAVGNVSFRSDIPVEVATATFGQGKVLVTAVQQVAAMSAIANGGTLMKPHLVKAIVDTDTGETIKEIEPEPIHQVLDPDVARKVGEYLEQVIADQEVGSGRRAYIDGYRIAGKTGTAQKVVDGKYSEDDQYVVSFLGYAPVDNPKIVFIILVDEPKINSYTEGGDVVGPVFKEVMGKSLRYLGIAAKETPKTVTTASAAIRVPDVAELSAQAAENELKRRSLQIVWIGQGDKVISQFPEAGQPAVPGETIFLLTGEADKVKLPDLTGYSLRDGLRVAAMLKLQVVVNGEGYIAGQKLTTREGTRVLELVLMPRDSLF